MEFGNQHIAALKSALNPENKYDSFPLQSFIKLQSQQRKEEREIRKKKGNGNKKRRIK